MAADTGAVIPADEEEGWLLSDDQKGVYNLQQLMPNTRYV